ncbi:MAG: MauE/DoxX family redox-associated membrane protein [Gemmataceae bacterium]
MVILSRLPGFGQALSPHTLTARGIPILVGVVLLTAAALKIQQLSAGPTTENTLFTSRWFLIGLVECELALGLWLLIGAYPKPARRAALAAFAGFSLVALYQALTGAPSCGCFGNVPIKPWYTLLLDLAIVAVLWRWNPETLVNKCRGGASNIHSHSFRLVAIGFLFLLTGIPAAIAMNSYRPALLQSSLSVIDFGTLPQAERGEIVFWFINSHKETMEIANIDSSCACFHVDLAQRTVAGGETIRAVARLELDKEPRFSGELQPEARGWTPSGALAFSIQAHVRVVRK